MHIPIFVLASVENVGVSGLEDDDDDDWTISLLLAFDAYNLVGFGFELFMFNNTLLTLLVDGDGETLADDAFEDDEDVVGVVVPLVWAGCSWLFGTDGLLILFAGFCWYIRDIFIFFI